MLNQIRSRGTDRFALASVFALVILAATIAVAVPAWSQTPTQEQETAAIEEEDAQVDVSRAARVGRMGHGGRPGFEARAQGRRAGFAGGPMGARRGRAGIGGGRYDLASRALGRAEQIGLTEVQTQGIEEARDAHRRQQIERDASMKLTGLDLAELLKDDSSDLAAVEQKMNEAAGLRVDEQMAALRYRRNVQGILSAEQIEQLQDVGDRAGRRRPSEDREPRTRRQR